VTIDDRVVEFAGGLDEFQHAADHGVGRLHFDRVVREVTAHRRDIGQVGRHGDVSELLAETHTRIQLVGAMGLLKTEPETKRFPFAARLQHRLEVFVVVVPRDAGGHPVVGGEVAERRPGGIARPAARLEIAGPPALADEADRVAGPFQDIWIRGKLVGKNSVVTRRLLQLPRVATGEDRGAARAALRISGKRMVEAHALARHAVDVRCLHPRAAVGAGVAPTPVVENDEENIRTFRRGRRRRGDGGKHERRDERRAPQEGEQGFFHGEEN
jgi:hypothetical protein